MTMMQRALAIATPLLLATVAFAVGGIWLEQEKSAEVVQQLSRGNVRAVVELVREATRAALSVHAKEFDRLEQRLHAEASNLLDAGCVGPCLQRADPWLRVCVIWDEGNRLHTEWGPLANRDRSRLTELARTNPDRLQLVETDKPPDSSLLCTVGGNGGRTGAFCADTAPLEAWLLTIGPGAILRNIEQQGIEYVAIQDESGILAASPSVDRLSSVSADPFLRDLDGSDPADVNYRTLKRDSRNILEGVGQIALPDGSLVLLRVGIDSTPLDRLASQRNLRRIQLSIAGILLLVIAGLASWFISRYAAIRARHDAERERFTREEARWEDLGRMAAMTAHEVRNPLSTIRMAAQRIDLEHCDGDCAPLRELVGVITREADRLDNVVGDFLSLSRPLTIDPKPVSLKAVVDDVVTSLQVRAMRRDQTLMVEGQPDVVVSADRSRLAQLVQNLLLNALDAAGDSGRVTVCVDRDESRGEAVIEVTDDGPGMDEEVMNRALETFFTTKSFGTGLGLPLVKRIAERHGGSLELTNRPEGGLLAIVRLPVETEDDDT